MRTPVCKGRRRFLKHVGAGGAVVTVPAFLAGCGVMPVADLRPAPPQNPFLDWFGIDEAMMARVMSELTARGAEHAELYFQYRGSRRLQMQDAEARVPRATIDQGAGLRVVVDGQSGFAHTEDLTLPALLGAARRATAQAAGSPAPSPSRFTLQATPDVYPVTVPWSEVAEPQRLAVLERLSQAVTATGDDVIDVSIDWFDADERVLIATLDGRCITDRRPLTRLSLQVRVRRGSETHAGFASLSARAGIDWYSDARLDKLAQDAVQRAGVRFEARQPPLGEMPVVLAAGSSGIILHEALGHALEADFNDVVAGPYAGRLHEQVAAPIITVIDDATMPYERGALNIDDEGAPGQRNVLIENGTLQTYLHDKVTASRFGVVPNGAGRRESFRVSPMPRMTCTRIANGSSTREEILAAVDRGILAETYTDGQVDPLSGDFSFAISTGWLLEKGRPTMPIRDVRVSGNGPEMLQRITMLGNDGRMDEAGWTCGKRGQQVPVSHGMPTALVSRLRVSA